MAGMAVLAHHPRAGTQRSQSLGSDWNSASTLSLSRAGSAVDMRQLTASLLDAREGTGEVRACLLRAAFKPRLPGLTKLVSKLSKEGAWRKALEVFEAVEEMGLVPDTALTNSAISACDKGGRWQKALEIFESMERQRPPLPRDAITYSATISALAKGKMWHAALQVFDHMQAHGVEADVVTCCSLINALERGGQWQLAEKLFLQMCTVQGEATLTEEPLPAVLAGAAASPASVKMLRSQTSPSSVLDTLQSPPHAGGGLMSIVESPRNPEATRCLFDLDSPSLGTLSVLGSTQQGQQHDVLRGLASAQNGPLQGSPVEGLAGRFSATMALSPGGDSEQRGPNGRGASPGAATPLGLERGGSSDEGASGQQPNPFAAASKLISGLRKSSPSCSETSLQNSESQQAAFERAARAGSSGSVPTPPPGLARTSSGISPPSTSPKPLCSSTSLARTHSLRREQGAPQLEAAQSLRRAMSCYPELAGGSMGEGTGLATLFNFSHAARVTPNRVCCNALLAAYARAKPPQYQRALHLLAAMWDGGPTLVPDAVSYNTAIKACTNAFQVGRALEVHREMVRRGVKPSVTSFNSLITAASDGGSYDALLEVGRCLAEADPEVQACVMNTYVAGLVKVGHFDEALGCFRDMLSPTSPTRPTASTFNTMMSMFMRQGRCEQVRSAFDDMLATGLMPSIVSYNTLLASYASLGAWREALDAITHVLAAQADGVNPNTTTFNTCLSAVAKGAAGIPPHQRSLVASRALQVFHQLRATPGCAADAATFSSLLCILDACEQFPQVVGLHDVMLASGHTPDAPTARLVLRSALKAGQMQKAFSLAQSLQMQGESVGAEALTSLLAACLGAGAWDLALQLCNAALFAEGPEVAPLFEHLLERAAQAQRFDTVVQVLTAMRAADLPVSPAVADLVMNTRAGSAPGTDGAASLASIETAAAAVSALQGASSPTVGLGSVPSAFEGAAGSGPFACLPGFAGLAAGAGSRAASLGGSPSMSAPQALPPPPPPPQSPAAPSPAITPCASMAPSPAASPAGLPHVSLGAEDTNALLASMKERLDVRGGLAVLENMKLAGIQPNSATYAHLVELAVRAGQPHLAVRLTAEAHEACALCCYALPNLAAGAPHPGTALGNVIDLRACSLEVGVAALLTWLTRCVQLQPLGLVVRDRHVKIILSGQPCQGGEAAGHTEQRCATLHSELVSLLTTGSSSLPAFQGLVPVQLEAEAVTAVGDGSALLISTPSLYKAMPPATCVP
ncbi:hypothetical protein ABPG77_008674 [Micractinium sp. CCAP 211/92]